MAEEMEEDNNLPSLKNLTSVDYRTLKKEQHKVIIECEIS